MEKQESDLRFQLENGSKVKEDLQKSIEDLRRELTVKESELMDSGNISVHLTESKTIIVSSWIV